MEQWKYDLFICDPRVPQFVQQTVRLANTYWENQSTITNDHSYHRRFRPKDFRISDNPFLRSA
jgi:hypothetical protein